MDANTINVLTALASKAIDRERSARTDLAGDLADMARGVDPSTIRRAMEAAANALPYRMLMEDINDGDDAAVAFTRLRKRLTSRVLNGGPSSSSCALSNEAQRLEYAGYRAFLTNTEAFAD